MQPRISIITAVYNNERSIRQALESVLGQTYPNIELIVVDGGSKDNTLKIIEEYRPKIHRIISEKDHGIYDALNKGVAAATGDIVGFLHSDDQFASTHAIESIASEFEKGSVDGVYSDLQYVSRAQNTPLIIRHWQSCDFTPSLLKKGWMPPHPTLYLKRTIYDQVGNFDLKYPIAADYDFILRVFKNSDYRFRYLPQVTVQMQVGGASNRNLKKIMQKSSQDYEILKRHGFTAFATLFNKNFGKLKQLIVRKNS